MEPAQTEDLAALAAAAKAGDEAAQTRLFAELYPAVRKHVSFVLGFSSAVDDAVQVSMLEIYRALPGFRGESSPVTWALTIASRTARKQYRRELSRRDVPLELSIDPAVFDVDQASSAELALLARSLRKLAPKKREAFVLMAIFELSASEAAAILGTFANTAASRYRHARAELARLVENN